MFTYFCNIFPPLCLEPHLWQCSSLHSTPDNVVMYGENEWQLWRGLKKLFMQVALGRLQIQGEKKKKKKVFPPWGINSIFYIWQKDLGIHTAQTSNSSWTPLHEQETCEHATGFGLTTRVKTCSRVRRSLSRLSLLLFQAGTGSAAGPVQMSPLLATCAVCRLSEHLCTFPVFVHTKNYFTCYFTDQTSTSCLSPPSSSGNRSIQ